MIKEEFSREEFVIYVAKAMMSSARTAPKARGIDNLAIATISGEEIKQLSDKTKQLYEENNMEFFLRDAENILSANAIVLIGTKIEVGGLDCGYCGYASCAEKLENEKCPCVFNSHDLGIAIGSAVSRASEFKVDNRVMFSVGSAAKLLGFYGEDVAFGFAIPLSVSGKNPFFDR
ncbi:MAG: DUF2148 domain-containing protein [Bacteroidales bacterium]|jgi:uncharacterized ferredoxin-like protein|nr:DUF2148 domain-containing protein [Bacteroidales bacterium]